MPALSAFNFITAAKPQMRLVLSGGVTTERLRKIAPFICRRSSDKPQMRLVLSGGVTLMWGHVLFY